VPDLNSWDEDARRDFLSDMHYTTPSQALILAKALGVLPPRVFIVDYQPGDANDLGIGLTEPVAPAVLVTSVLTVGALITLMLSAILDHQTLTASQVGAMMMLVIGAAMFALLPTRRLRRASDTM
jgi:hypothetical protein